MYAHALLCLCCIMTLLKLNEMIELFRPARSFGDPHIITLDGLHYTFNGEGEYWLVQSTDFRLQARATRARNVQGTYTIKGSHVLLILTDCKLVSLNIKIQLKVVLTYVILVCHLY